MVISGNSGVASLTVSYRIFGRLGQRVVSAGPNRVLEHALTVALNHDLPHAAWGDVSTRRRLGLDAEGIINPWISGLSSKL